MKKEFGIDSGSPDDPILLATRTWLELADLTKQDVGRRGLSIQTNTLELLLMRFLSHRSGADVQDALDVSDHPERFFGAHGSLVMAFATRLDQYSEEELGAVHIAQANFSRAEIRKACVDSGLDATLAIRRQWAQDHKEEIASDPLTAMRRGLLVTGHTSANILSLAHITASVLAKVRNADYIREFGPIITGTIYEIQGHEVLAEHKKPFYFLPMFPGRNSSGLTIEDLRGSRG